MKFKSIVDGQTAEASFLLRTIALGYSVSKPFGNSDPYDFILDNGRRLIRVQIKSTEHLSNGGYVVPMRHGFLRGKKYRKNSFDFLVAWIRPYDAWYVIPIEKALGRTIVTLFPHNPDSHGRYESFREAWHLLAPQRRNRTSSPKCA